MNNLNNIFQTLGIDTTNGLYYTKIANRNTDLHLSSRVKRCLEQIDPDAFFCLDGKPLILFFENRTDNYLHKKIWNLNEIPVIIVVNNGSVEIFNGFNLLANENTLKKLGSDDKLTNFSYFQLVTGKTWEIYEKELSYENRVDNKLLDNIDAARNQILKQFSPVNDNNDDIQKRYVKIANALLGKVIFVRYLIDRKVKIYFDDESKERTNEEFCDILQQPDRAKQFFNALADQEAGFNGDLFHLEDTEYKEAPQEAYSVLIKLLKSQEISTGQQSLFDLYDFSIIPIEFISNVYEYFIGSKNQAKQGAYYTPLFLADYILSETIEKFISDNQAYNCKILDPACGSGVFLVETLRKMIEKYKENASDDREQFKNGIKDIVRNNIYGIDKDESAVQISIFSVYITLLDYMEPPEIADFKFPKLNGTNFFCADFFDKKAEFNTIFDSIKFDYIVGNPPWFRGKNEKEKPVYIKYIEERKKNEKIHRTTNLIGNKEIAQAFLFRSSDFCAENTKCALIVTSKVLYNLQSKDFRQYFLQNYLIEKVFELAPVRREIFDKSNDKAVAPACVLFFGYANGKNTDSNLIEHITLKPNRFFSMFKIFSIYRHDVKTVQQDRLKKYDWLWKLLVYGSYMDFNFIKRLKEDYPTIRDIIDKDDNLIAGQGIMVGGGDKNDASELVGKQFLDTKTDIRQFWINPNNNKTWKHRIVHRPRKSELYKAPMLLIAGGNNKELKCISAVNQKDAIFKSSLTAIKLDNIDRLRQIAGILNSSFFSYFNIQVFSSTCIEREESHDEEKLNIPFPKTNSISNKVEDLENLLIQKFQSTFEKPEIQKAINEKYIELDKAIYDAFSISKEEEFLLDYTNNIVIPVQMEHIGYEKFFRPCEINDNILNDYANLYIKRFAPNFEKIEKKFIVEIWHTQQIVGMFFKVISASEYKDDIVWIDKQADVSGLFQTIIQSGTTKITDQLFIQKDIKGFEKEYFYVFKPNEKCLWHKAVGYLDINEFAEAILKAGRDGK
ncbi:MAG: N-6 DNA methylase [Prevotellaceae bacterium]|jgi:hypothetical protein|nr:N-6 DNA methylase [Prevotellaceae bacterium]